MDRRRLERLRDLASDGGVTTMSASRWAWTIIDAILADPIPAAAQYVPTQPDSGLSTPSGPVPPTPRPPFCPTCLRDLP